MGGWTERSRSSCWRARWSLEEGLLSRMDEAAARRRLGESRVGHLATADAAGRPHVVPFVFALAGETIYWAVDRKPKRSRELKRLENIAANPAVEIVVDRFEDDWTRLWWARATGTARLVDDVDERAQALSLLAAKYEQYATQPPDGPVVAIDVARWSWWEAT